VIEFHDPLRGRFVRLREDNENAIRQYTEWGWQRVNVPEQVAPPAEEAPPAPAVPRRSTAKPKKAKK
jgi:hypothetical protein